MTNPKSKPSCPDPHGGIEQAAFVRAILERKQAADRAAWVAARDMLDEGLTGCIATLQQDVADLRARLGLASGVESGRSLAGDCRM